MLFQLIKFSQEYADKLGSGQRAVDQAIEKTTNNIQWRADNEDDVYNWLQATLENIGY